nr:MAG TPA: hypothetical protein [Caudoviricetes sp.]
MKCFLGSGRPDLRVPLLSLDICHQTALLPFRFSVCSFTNLLFNSHRAQQTFHELPSGYFPYRNGGV